MIGPTDEMEQAAWEARRHVSISTPETRMRASIRAVLAIVERYYDVRCGAVRPSEISAGGVRCDRKPGHDVQHDGDHMVSWPVRMAEPVVHQLTAGDEFVHCCGRKVADVDREHGRTTLNPHGVTCGGPS